MQGLYHLRDSLKEELEQMISQRSGRKLSAGEVETVNKYAETIKNLDKIISYDENEGYSMNYGGNYNRGMQGYSRNYSGENWTNNSDYSGRRRRDSMGRYTRSDEIHSLRERMESMMNEGDMDGRKREALRRALDELRTME